MEEKTSRFGSYAWLVGGAIFLIAWTAWWYRNGEDSYLRIHDCLNSTVSIGHILAQPPWLLAPSQSKFEPLANIPRHCVYSEMEVRLWVHRILPTLWAYAACELLFRLIAYAGAFLLLHHYVWPAAGSPDWRRVVWVTGLAVCFAMLPFWVPGQLSSMGLPFVLWALLNLRFGVYRVFSWIVLAAFPFFSNLVLIGVFVAPILGAAIVVDAAICRRISWPLVGAGFVLSIGWCVTQHRLFEARYFNSNFVSMRSEYTDVSDILSGRNSKHSYTQKQANWEWRRSFLSGEDSHAPARQAPAILSAVALASAVGLGGCLWCFAPILRRQTLAINQVEHELRPGISTSKLAGYLAQLTPMLAAVGVCMATTWWLGWYRLPFTGLLIHAMNIELLNELNLARINWLQPLMWFLAFSYAIRILGQIGWLGAVASLVFVGGQIVWLTHTSEHAQEQRQSGLTFREYYSADLFAEISEEIGRDQTTYRVGSVGLEPIIALNNGFYTVDGSFSNYDLKYKQRFRKIIAGELAKNSALMNQFDTLGVDFFLFSAELFEAPSAGRASGNNRLFLKNDDIRSIESLEIDLEEFRSLGGEYILSAVEINNAVELGLKHRGVFSHDDSPWEIRLYELPPLESPPEPNL